MIYEIDPALRATALGPAPAFAGGSVVFIYVAQEAIAITGVFASPAEAVSKVEVTLVRHEPEKANVRRFEDGSTISDQGISSETHELEGDPEAASGRSGSYRVPRQIGHLRAGTLQRIEVTVHNRGNTDVEMRGALLYQRLIKSAVERSK